MNPLLPPELVLAAYRRGLFPMAVDRAGTIGWFSPDPRAIIPLDDRFHVPHGLKRIWKKVRVDAGSADPAGAEPVCPGPPLFRVTFDRAFSRVIRACADRREGTWISEPIVQTYCVLHRLGHAHSTEVWQAGPTRAAACRLVGGLYGVHLGGAFFGESMFHRVADASKVALVALVQRLRRRAFVLLDTQWLTPHLARFGAYEIPRAEYLRLLARALVQQCSF